MRGRRLQLLINKRIKNKVLPRKINLKKQKYGQVETDSNNNELLKKTISCRSWNNKREGNASQNNVRNYY
jgi:hypothetical protein